MSRHDRRKKRALERLKGRRGVVDERLAKLDRMKADVAKADEELVLADDALIEALMDKPEMWSEIRKLCDGLAKSLDEYRKIPYARDDRGAIVLTGDPKDPAQIAERERLAKALADVLHRNFYANLIETARQKGARDERAQWFAETAIKSIGRRMVREEPLRGPSGLHAAIQLRAFANRLAHTKMLLQEIETLPEAERSRVQLDAVNARVDATSRALLRWTRDFSDPEKFETQKTVLVPVLEECESAIEIARTFLGLEAETEERIAEHYEQARIEMTTRYDELKKEQSSEEQAQWPWERDEKELGADSVYELRMLSDVRRLQILGDALRSRKLDDSAIVDAHRRLIMAMDATKRGKLGVADAVPRHLHILRSVEEAIRTARTTLDLPPETPEDVAANYERVRAEYCPSTKDGILAEIAHANGEIQRARERSSTAGMSFDGLIGFRNGFAGLTHETDDRALMDLGLALWNDTYRGNEPADAQRVIRAHLTRLYRPAPELRRYIGIHLAEFAALWAHDAFQKIVTTHTYAAALMCTDANADALGDLYLPWRAFMVAIPDGLLRFEGAEGQEVHYRRALVHVEADGRASLIVYDPDMRSGVSNLLHSSADNLADLLFDPPVNLATADGSASDLRSEQRAMKMVLRLVTGILVALLYTQDYKKPKQKPREFVKGSRERREPEHRVTFVGKPLKIDCREEVRRFIAKPSGRRDPKAPAVQYMVRGHQKRQVVGVGRLGRKVIWIEPYWKGDPEAPILTKPRLVTRTS